MELTYIPGVDVGDMSVRPFSMGDRLPPNRIPLTTNHRIPTPSPPRRQEAWERRRPGGPPRSPGSPQSVPEVQNVNPHGPKSPRSPSHGTMPHESLSPRPSAAQMPPGRRRSQESPASMTSFPIGPRHPHGPIHYQCLADYPKSQLFQAKRFTFSASECMLLLS